jgi:hypothetical protein
MWINQAFLKTFTPINQNVDISEVANHIESAELIYVRELLGKLLYDDLTIKINSSTLSPIEEELVDLVKQLEAYRAAEIAIPFLGIKIRNKGVVKLNDEFAQPASVEEMKYLRNELKNRADYFTERASQFLCDYSSDFPLWLRTSVNGVKNNPYPTNSGFGNDIFIGDDALLRRNRYWYGDNSNEPGNTY